MKKVFLGLSGGVDSALSAYLLREQGYDVTGVYMKNWSRNLPGMKCPWAEDLADAKRTAVRLGLDFQVFDFETEYKQKVVDYMLAEYQKGNTPNPDIMCNQEIKFKLFADTAFAAGADLIATGHYARTDAPLPPSTTGVLPGGGQDAPSPIDTVGVFPGGRHLLRARDENKDQSYFLYRIAPEVIPKTLFPVGHMTKPEVKALAEKVGLTVAHKSESMGVCFVGEANMRDFLSEFVKTKPGPIVELETGAELGFHDGAIFYTLGQRHGLGLTTGLPYYVVKKDMAKNTVYVSRNLNARALWADQVVLRDLVFRGPLPDKLTVRIRHRASLIPATFEQVSSTLHFSSAQKSLTPGQSIVFYADEICLGGGVIL